MGSNIKIPTISAFRNPLRSIANIVKEREEEKLDKLKNGEKNIKEYLKIKMEKSINNVPWDHNDHSISHNERILKKIPSLVKNLEAISFSKEFLEGKTLSDLDKEILRYSVILHDIGRCDPNMKNHALSGRKFIEKIKEDIHPEIRKEVAFLTQLHTPSGIKELGGKSLADLVDKKIITKRQAYLASVLTIGDALDAGKARVQKNTQGEQASKVINKIKESYSKGMAKSKLEHWYGHQGFSGVKLMKERNELKLKINLDSKMTEKNSTAIAFRIFDTIKDITTSYLPVSKKFKFELKIVSKDREKAEKWYNENKLIFKSEKKLSNVEFEQIK